MNGRMLRSPAGLLAVLLLTLGCTGRGRFSYNKDELPSAPPWPDQQVTNYPFTDVLVYNGLATAFGNAQGQTPSVQPAGAKPLSVLVLSGGAKFTAFNAGALVGWTASGQRPKFDIATGVSAGALAASLAFLGPKYDCRLTELYTTLSREDLFRFRPIMNLIRYRTITTPEPLEGVIAKEVTETYLADLREAHTEGRRLFVATNLVKAQRLVIWDLGAIACSGRQDAGQLIRKVLLAATCINGWTTPVSFDVDVNGCRYVEEHGDGGIHTEAFLQTTNGLTAGSNVFVLTAGKLFPDPLADKPGFLTLFYSNISCALSALYRADLLRIYTLCVTSRSNFLLMSLPQNTPGKASSMVFEPEEMQKLYRIGYQMSANGIAWRTAPPGVPPNEQPPVRIGTPGLPLMGETPKHSFHLRHQQPLKE